MPLRYLLPPVLRRVHAGGHIGRPTFVPTMLLTSETPRAPNSVAANRRRQLPGSSAVVSKTCRLRRAPENRRRDVGRARTGGSLLSETAGGQETRLLTAPKPA